MELINTIFQIIIPLGIINVWLVRRGGKTAYRGGDAANLKDEFTAYGLPTWCFYTVGALKILAAAMIFLGLWIPALVFPGAALMSALMVGALIMHAKVGDPGIRYLPAGLMLLMSLTLLS